MWRSRLGSQDTAGISAGGRRAYGAERGAKASAQSSDRRNMHEIFDVADVPPAIVVERRHQRDRRSFWRGGRRNTDWMSRPIGAWRSLEQRLSPWRQWIAKLPLPRLSPHGEARQ